MNRWEELRSAGIYALIAIATCIVFGALFVVVHEHIHSAVAYLMGHMRSPLEIVWGNLLTLDGWDEGVSYSAMFSAGQGADAAIIAVSPLIMHTAFVIGGLRLLLSDALVRKRWLFHLPSGSSSSTLWTISLEMDR